MLAWPVIDEPAWTPRSPHSVVAPVLEGVRQPRSLSGFHGYPDGVAAETIAATLSEPPSP